MVHPSFTPDELLDRIALEYDEDIDVLIDDLISELDGPGACVQCGDVFDHVLTDQTAGWCDECGAESIMLIRLTPKERVSDD